MTSLDPNELEQLERLLSEDNTRRPMITHTIDSYWIPSQNKTKSKLQIQRVCQNFKYFNFEKKTLHATHLLLKLLDKMCKYEMDLVTIVEDTERTRFCPPTDRRTRWNQYSPFNFVGRGGIISAIGPWNHISCNFTTWHHWIHYKTATESSRPPFPCLWNERLYDCFMPLQILLNTTWQNVIVFRKWMSDIFNQIYLITHYSLWPINAIWHHRTWSTLVQVIAWCLMAPSHYLNQCWILVSGVQWHSLEGNFAASTQATIWKSYFWNYCHISLGPMS